MATNCQMSLNPIEDKLYLPGNKPSCFSRCLWKRKIFQKSVPHILMDELTGQRVTAWDLWLLWEQSKLSPLHRNWNECLVFQYNHATKRQSMNYRTKPLPELKTFRLEGSRIKPTLIALFHKQGMLHTETVSQGKIMEEVSWNFVLRIFVKIYFSLAKFKQKCWEPYMKT